MRRYFPALLLVLVFLFSWFFVSPTTAMLYTATALCTAVITLGLNIQSGYAGLFNVGVLGFIALGGFATVMVAMPMQPEAWQAGGAGVLACFIKGLVLAAVLYLVGRFSARVIGENARICLLLIIGVLGFGWVSQGFSQAAMAIEATPAGYIGGLGLPIWLGWLVGGILAAVAAWFVARVTLGLRSDYLAIATLGISEIIRDILKNADWLTRGTLTVSPIPWPVSSPGELAEKMKGMAPDNIDLFLQSLGVAPEQWPTFYGRLGFITVVGIIVIILFIMMQKALYSPWGRMMRAIRDNLDAAQAMGKDVVSRQRQAFVLGAVLIGIGGAMLATLNGLYDPSAYQPPRYTFLIWAMLIIGGSGNNKGAIFGTVFIYFLWELSDPLVQVLFKYIDSVLHLVLPFWKTPDDFQARAAQMRILIIGLALILTLRYRPGGMIPEPLSLAKSKSSH